jgi:septal ring factor EnvC (AmiA/AmiB activator)
MRNRVATLAGTVMLAAFVAAGCESPQTKERLAQMAAVSAEKDSLLQIMSENTRLMSEISTELAKVKDIKKPTMQVGTAESPLATSMTYRDSLKSKIHDVVERVNAAEERLAASQRRIRTLSRLSDSLRPQLEMAQQAITDLQATLENQRTSIATLEDQVRGLTEEKTVLTAQNVALGDTVKQLDTERNTVYYVIGTKDELKEKGILTEEGSKFLIFGGKALVPARTLDPSVFTAVDRREVAEVPLPDPEREYKIVSRQNLEFLGEQPEKGGKVKGALHITEPERFWAPSRFLIIVES